MNRRQVLRLLLVPAASSLFASEAYTWGYISTNVTTRDSNGRNHRVKYVSTVFSFCYSEVKPDHIAADEELQLRQGIHSKFGDSYTITYNFVDTASTEEAANRKREAAMRDSNYEDHIGWVCTLSYYGKACR